MKKFFSLSLLFFIIWIWIGGIQVQELLLGLSVSLVLGYLLSPSIAFELSLKTLPKALLFIFLYVPVLVIELIKANLDVARRVLSPSIPLNPGIVKIPTAVKSDLGKLVLANSITLTPGTLSLDADDENVYIHWIDIPAEPTTYQKQVSGRFETILRRIFND